MSPRRSVARVLVLLVSLPFAGADVAQADWPVNRSQSVRGGSDLLSRGAEPFLAAESSLVRPTASGVTTWRGGRGRPPPGLQHVEGLPANHLDAKAGSVAIESAAALSEGNGGMFVSWQDSRDGLPDIYVQRFTSDGGIAAGWPTQGLAVCRARGVQEYPRLASDGTGGVLYSA